jgi:hypothetical protein
MLPPQPAVLGTRKDLSIPPDVPWTVGCHTELLTIAKLEWIRGQLVTRSLRRGNTAIGGCPQLTFPVVSQSGKSQRIARRPHSSPHQ